MARAIIVLLLVGACGDGDPPTDRMDGGFDGAFPDAAMTDGGIMDGSMDSGAAECGDGECDYCASQGACLGAGQPCAFDGDVGGEYCWSRFTPCDVASCWLTEWSVPMCRAVGFDEDFSSGRYSVHRYATTLPAGEPISLRVTRLAGPYQPSLFVATMDGALVFAGDETTLDPAVQVLEAGGDVDQVFVRMQVERATAVLIYVSGGSVSQAGFDGVLDTGVRYNLRAEQECEVTTSDSESIGATNNGRLENGVRVMDHPGFVVADTGRNAEYGTQETVDLLYAAFDAVVARHPDAARVQVRDISVEGGGEPSGYWPHASHQSGRDVDVTYHLDACAAAGCPVEDVDLAEFDVAATWTLFEYWLSMDAVTFIFVDRALQAVLYDEAGRRGATSEQLDAWFQYPSSERRGIIRHVDNHLNHHHVRFRCPSDDTRCID